jgi:large subunit ribosomal protein L10
MKTIPQSKIDFVKQLQERYEGEKDFFFTDYRGLNVAQLTVLRGKLRASSAELKVVKNNLAKIAFKNLKHDSLEAYLKGPTTVVSVDQGASSQVARILNDYTAETSLVIKGGMVEGEIYDAKQVIEYGKLPTRPEAIGQFMGVLNGAMSKLARTLKALGDAKPE